MGEGRIKRRVKKQQIGRVERIKRGEEKQKRGNEK